MEYLYTSLLYQSGTRNSVEEVLLEILSFLKVKNLDSWASNDIKSFRFKQ